MLRTSPELSEHARQRPADGAGPQANTNTDILAGPQLLSNDCAGDMLPLSRAPVRSKDRRARRRSGGASAKGATSQLPNTTNKVFA